MPMIKDPRKLIERTIFAMSISRLCFPLKKWAAGCSNGRLKAKPAEYHARDKDKLAKMEVAPKSHGEETRASSCLIASFVCLLWSGLWLFALLDNELLDVLKLILTYLYL